MARADAGALGGGWQLGFVLATLPMFPWPIFAFLTMLASSGVSDPPTPAQVMGYVLVWFHTFYPLLFWLAWRGVRVLRRQGRAVSAALLLAVLPLLSAAIIGSWVALGSVPGPG